MKVKAVKIGATAGLDHLEIAELSEPNPPGPGEIRVRVHASSLNYHDYGVAKRGGPTHAGRILMADGAGLVEEVGAGVTEFNVGDHVVSTFFPTWLDGEPTEGDFSTVPGDGVDGYACEIVVRPATWFTHTPEGFSYAEAATLTTAGLTAWRALVGDGHLKAGDTVLVLGTGGVSIFALQIAKVMGATVVVTSSSTEKLARARQLGADHTINYKDVPDWGEAVQRWSGGRGVDHVIELGGPGTVAQSIKAARVGGHISLIGTLTGYAGQVPTAAMMIKQIRLQGLIVGNRRQQQQMIEALACNDVRPVIDRTFPLEKLAEAFQFQESGSHFGKICVEY
jgi:NADPH:quinone reductase-like Zn-dependent oxidoreductase